MDFTQMRFNAFFALAACRDKEILGTDGSAMLTTSSHGLTQIFANFGPKSVFICENPCPLKRKIDFSDKLLAPGFQSA
jgi:hypothetical protein